MFLFNIVTELRTDPARIVCTAAARCVSSSLANRSPSAARQSSIEVSGLAGLNTSDVWRSKPVLEKAEKTHRPQDRMISQTGHVPEKGIWGGDTEGWKTSFYQGSSVTI